MELADWRVTPFLVVCFYKLDPEIKTRFAQLVDSRKLDTVLWKLIQERFFPDCVSGSLWFDPLYGQLLGLRTVLKTAVQDLLLTVHGPRSEYCFHNFSEGELKNILKRANLEDRQITKIVEELNKRLLAD